jgi:hypothetical protein
MKWLMLFLSLTAQAENILYREPGQSAIDYQAALKAQGELISPTADYRRLHPLKENRARLNARFAEAQKAFLNRDQLSARGAFQKVVELVSNDDWKASDRSVFALSYFRLAQLESENSRQDFWLRKILALGDDTTVDQALVPPPLLKRFKKIRQTTPVRDLSPVLGAWDRLLINGWVCAKCEFPEIKESLRITWLSDEWEPVTQVVTADTLSTPPEGKPWPPPAKMLNLKTEPSVAELPLLTETRTRKPFWKSPWLWAALGGAVAAAVIIDHNRHRSSSEPTTTYGY